MAGRRHKTKEYEETFANLTKQGLPKSLLYGKKIFLNFDVAMKILTKLKSVYTLKDTKQN